MVDPVFTVRVRGEKQAFRTLGCSRQAGDFRRGENRSCSNRHLANPEARLVSQSELPQTIRTSDQTEASRPYGLAKVDKVVVPTGWRRIPAWWRWRSEVLVMIVGIA